MPALMASMFCDMFRRAMARITAVWFSLTLIVIFPSPDHRWPGKNKGALGNEAQSAYRFRFGDWLL
jgi:hypothetical protein